MKSSSFAKAITLGCLVLVAVPVACGDDTTNASKPNGNAGAAGDDQAAGGTDNSAGNGGASGAAPMIPGTSTTSQTIKCGGDMCSSIKALSTTPLYVNPCCAGAAKDACGLSTEFFGVLGASFNEVCQATGQEGPPDAACPNSPDQMLPFSGSTFHVPGFVGCCRAETGTCGVVIDEVTVKEIPLPFASPKLGCVDSAPFFGNVAGKACGAGAGGAGGMSAGGAGGISTGGAGGVFTAGAGGAGGAFTGGAGAGGAGGPPP